MFSSSEYGNVGLSVENAIDFVAEKVWVVQLFSLIFCINISFINAPSAVAPLVLPINLPVACETFCFSSSSEVGLVVDSLVMKDQLSFSLFCPAVGFSYVSRLTFGSFGILTLSL